MFESTDNHINLIYAKSPEYNATSAYYIEGYALINKSRFEKNIIINYTYDTKSWFTSKANFLTNTKYDNEIWHFKTPNTYNYTSCNFALCCKINEKEYWDNNNNMNYSLKWYSPTKILKNCNIILDKASKSSNKFYGNILIKNLAYNKQVKVRYSFDDWETFSEIDAIYSYQFPNNLENWKFSIPVLFSCKIKFIVYYIVNGITYFDNNFGKNYII